MIYVSSDWHGASLEAIERLLDQANFTENDFLYVLGDVIDRGEHGVELLKWMMPKSNIKLILGNHEAMLLGSALFLGEESGQILDDMGMTVMECFDLWNYNGGEPTVRSLQREAPEIRHDIVTYLHKAPLFDRVTVGEKAYVLVHGGLDGFAPEKKMEEYTASELLWARPAPDTRYSEEFTTVLGHTPTRYYGYEHKGKILKMPTWIDVDTGTADGLPPALLCLDNGEEFYL